jgi:hypothetical protein
MLEKIYQVNLPGTINGLIKFDFIANTDDGGFHFFFWYFSNQWNCWVKLPGGEIRTIGVYPNNLNWGSFLDYSLLISFSANSITFEDLSKIGVYILKWQQ